MGSLPTSDAAQHFVIWCNVNVGLSIWEGMADRRNCHANTKLTGHSRTSPRLEQGAYCRPKDEAARAAIALIVGVASYRECCTF